MPGLESSGYEGFRDKEKKLLISCFGVHVTNSNTHNLSTRIGNFMRKSVIITGFLINDDVAAVNNVDGD
jgi:hypothetical protein